MYEHTVGNEVKVMLDDQVVYIVHVVAGFRLDEGTNSPSTLSIIVDKPVA
jgi:hypothetical protein